MEESKGSEPPRHSSRDDNTTPTPMTVTGGGGKSDQGTSIPDFSLCAALVGHTGDVRSLAVGKSYLYSGARDSVVMAWPLDEEGHISGTHTAPAAQIILADWVNALTVAPAGGEETVVAGCKDGVIYVVAWEGGGGHGHGHGHGHGAGKLVVKTTLLGHTAPISSLSWSNSSVTGGDGGGGLLLSGSWDETAKAWDLETATCNWTLGGHENNVCVLGLGPGSVATGSTGLNVEGHLVGQQIRMWEGSPPKECRSLTDHTSGIRDLCLVASSSPSPASSSSSSSSKQHSFCSASNDGTVRAWSADGDPLAVFTIPDESFVFSVCHLGGGLVASGDDTGCLCAARVASPVAPSPVGVVKQDAKVLFQHPKTVWSVAALGAAGGGVVEADVATGSADYAVRVFTADDERKLRDDQLEEAEEALGEGGDVCTTAALGGGSSAGGVGERLPSVSEMGIMVGAEDGQLSAFADEATGAALVFRWAAEESKWQSLGPLRPPTKKVEFEGGLYDKVIPVEVDSASRGFLTFQLGFNKRDDPKTVANAFCQKHSLGPEYLPQIEQFLLIASL